MASRLRGAIWKYEVPVNFWARASRGRRCCVLPIWKRISGWSSSRVIGRSDCCMSSQTQLHLQAGLSNVDLQIDAHRSQWPAAFLIGLGAPWNTLQPEGQLHLRTDALGLQWSVGRLQVRGLVELEAQDISSRLSTLRPMGSYRLQMRGTPQGSRTPELILSTTQGPLKLSGQGQWVGARLRFTGEASAEEGSESALSNLLNIIGIRQGTRSLLSLG